MALILAGVLEFEQKGSRVAIGFARIAEKTDKLVDPFSAMLSPRSSRCFL